MHLRGPPQYNTCRLLVRSKWTSSSAGIVFWWILGQHGCSTVLFLDKYWVYCNGGDQLFDCVFCDLCCHDFYCLRFVEKKGSEQIKAKMIIHASHEASKSRLSVFVTVQFIVYELPIGSLIIVSSYDYRVFKFDIPNSCENISVINANEGTYQCVFFLFRSVDQSI